MSWGVSWITRKVTRKTQLERLSFHPALLRCSGRGKAWPNPANLAPASSRAAPRESDEWLGNGAQPGSHLPPCATSYLRPPVNVYKAGPAASKSVQRPDPAPAFPGSFFLLAGAGPQDGGRGGRTRLPAACVTLSAPLCLQPTPAPLPRSLRRYSGVSSWGPASCRPASPLTGDSCQAEPGKGIFRAVDLTPDEFPLL